MERPDSRFTHQWHVSINRHADATDFKSMRFMYEAKALADEVPRLTSLFKAEREGSLPAVHKQCSRQEAVPVPNNHLTCCRGVKCAECPFLLALDTMDATPEQIDTAKAWTCAAHIVSTGGDVANEGYVLRVDDRMFWDSVYQSMAMEDSP